MKIKVQKWGYSLAIRIPKSFALETEIDNGSLVDLSLADGKLIATPIKKKKYTLAELMKSVCADNIHTEVDSGEKAGHEIW
ncbi:AbrB/MazE/SpoVT family DNA-binding domain-containing protein [bacterium]|nr:AbrB/MazE/SpoVT family DNA-binding domain-containing protein [bacterium]